MLKNLIAALLAFVAAAAFASVDVNKASQADLESVNGIGPTAASKILAERQKGAFKDWGDVMQRVGGIKEAKAAKLSEAGLTVNGESFKGGAAKSDQPAKEKKAKTADAGKSESPMAKK